MRFNYREIYWPGSMWQGLVMMTFLLNILRTKNCSGISLKTQILYALIFTTKHVDLEHYYVPVVNYVFKVVFLVMTYGTVLSIYKFFSKTHDKQNDTCRIDITIVACIVLSLIFTTRYDPWELLMAFSLFLEVPVMIPQFLFVYKAQRIEKSVFLYITGMAIYSFFQIVYLCYHHDWHDSSIPDVAATTQFLLYCDFFRAIYPLIAPEDDGDVSKSPYCRCFKNIRSFLCSGQSKDVEQADAEVTVATEPSKTGHFASNVSNIILTPFTLPGVHKNKGLTEPTEDAEDK